MRANSGSFSLGGLTAGLAIAMFLPVSVGAGEVRLRNLAALLLISGLALLLGRALGVIFRIPRTPGFIEAFEVVGGFAVLSLLELGVTTGCNLSAGSALLVSAPGIVLLFLCRGRLAGLPRTGAPAATAGGARREILVLLALSGVVTLWSREALGALRQAEKSGIFDAWEDFLAHASQIAYLKSYPAFGRQSLYLAGTPQIFYHRASYALSAAFSCLTGQTALQASLYFWLPLGLVLMGMAAYGLGCALAGRTAGAVAAAGLLLLPDASAYGLHNGFFGFHWLMEIAPASGYGVAAALLGLAVFVIGIAESQFRLVLLGAALAALSAFFKVHIAILAAPLFLLLVFASWRPAQGRRYAAAALAVALGGLGSIILFEHIAMAPHLLTGPHEFLKFFSFVHAQEPPGSAGLYARWTAHSGALQQSLIGAGLVLPAAFGAILPALILAALWPSRARWAWQVEGAPFALLGVYLAVIFLLPTPANGDSSEFSHRPFVLVYAVLATYLAAMLVVVFRGLAAGHRWPRRGALLLVFSLLAAGLGLAWRASARLQQSTLAWGPEHAEMPMPAGLLAAARVIRENSRPEDCLLSSDGDPGGLVLALTEQPAFLSHQDVFRSLRIPQSTIAAARGRLLAALGQMRRYEDLADFGREHGVRWFLLRPGDMPGWPPAVLDRSRWRFGGTRVFDLSRPKN